MAGALARRVAHAALILAPLVLGGCVYNPYTGTFVPCCGYYGYGYGYPYYRYPPPPYYPPYGYQQAPAPQGPPQQGPYMLAPQQQPGGYPNAPPEGQPPPQPGAANQPRGGGLAERFAAANVTHDGRLTRAQAAAMPMVARNFETIDVEQKGYVTLPEIRAYAAQRRAERAQAG